MELLGLNFKKFQEIIFFIDNTVGKFHELICFSDKLINQYNIGNIDEKI